MDFDTYDPENGSYYDETFAARGQPRAGFEPLVEGIRALEPGVLASRQVAAERALLPSTAVRERESGLALGAVVTRHLHSLSGLGVIAATPRAVLLLGLEEGTCLRGRHHEARRIELDHGALHDVLRLRH